jgi:integrase
MKQQSSQPSIKVGTDKGILRLQFSRKFSREAYGKNQFYKSLGRSDTPENRRWAENIARHIQQDIDHPDNLFDLTLEKYLGIKINIASSPLVDAKAELTIGELWLEFAEYKLKTRQIHQTTYKASYMRMYLNWLTPYFNRHLSRELAEQIVFELSQTACKGNLRKLLGLLAEACDRAVHNEWISKNYFFGLRDTIKPSKKSKQLTEEDYKAFSKEERDIIIETFYTSNRNRERQAAPLIEFLFLTGCRIGEVFALKWNDIRLDKGWIVFDESYSSEHKILKETKTNVIRIFRLKSYTRLLNLIERVKPDSYLESDFVFLSVDGEKYNRAKLNTVWNGTNKSKQKYLPGVVTRLANEKKISQYLKPSATRHTFITIQAHHGADLKLLADSVGNSVDVIYNHYLGVNKDAILMNI